MQKYIIIYFVFSYCMPDKSFLHERVKLLRFNIWRAPIFVLIPNDVYCLRRVNRWMSFRLIRVKTCYKAENDVMTNIVKINLFFIFLIIISFIYQVYNH